jgi:hypothetical protein
MNRLPGKIKLAIGPVHHAFASFWMAGSRTATNFFRIVR